MEDIVRTAKNTLRGMWAHRRLGLLVAWAVGLLAFGAVMMIPDRYEASARIFVNTDTILKPLMSGLTVQPNDDQRIAMLARVVITRPNVENLVKATGLDAKATNKAELDAIVDRTLKTLEFRPAGRDNSLFQLTFRDTNPERAKRAVELMAQNFIQSSRGGKSDDTQTAKRFIDEQIAAYDKKLQEAEARLKEFRLRYIGIGTGEGRDFHIRVAEAERALNQARLELREAERSREAYRRQLAAEQAPLAAEGAAPPPVNNTALVEIDSRLEAQRRNVDNLLQRFTDQHPDVIGARRVIRDLEEQRRQVAASIQSGAPSPVRNYTASSGLRASETLKVSLAQAEASVASLSARVGEYQSRYDKLRASAAMVPQQEAELAQLNRDYEVHKRNYETLVARRESANIAGEMQAVVGGDDIRLVDPPRVPERPVAPNRTLLVPVGLLVALFAGVAAAFAGFQLRPTFLDGRTLREATGLPLLGVVSRVPNERRDRAERRSAYRFAGGVGALVGTYLAGFIALHMLMARAA